MVHGRNVLELGKDGPDPERDGLDMRHNDLGVLQPALAVMLSGFCESLMILGTTCLPLKGLLPDIVVTIIIKSVDSFVRNVYSGRSIEFGIKTTISYSKLVRPLENSYDEDFFFLTRCTLRKFVAAYDCSWAACFVHRDVLKLESPLHCHED